MDSRTFTEGVDSLTVDLGELMVVDQALDGHRQEFAKPDPGVCEGVDDRSVAAFREVATPLGSVEKCAKFILGKDRHGFVVGLRLGHPSERVRLNFTLTLEPPEERSQRSVVNAYSRCRQRFAKVGQIFLENAVRDVADTPRTALGFEPISEPADVSFSDNDRAVASLF